MVLTLTLLQIRWRYYESVLFAGCWIEGRGGRGCKKQKRVIMWFESYC